MGELELKFGVDPVQADAIDQAMRRAGAQTLELESRYVDTADFRLGAAGLALRLRRTGSSWEQTLKAPADGLVERLEETVARPGRWGRDGPAPDPTQHDGTAAGALLRKALGDLATASLAPVCTSRFVRRVIDIDIGGATVELALDRGRIEAAGRSLPLCELEIELKDGDASALVAWARGGVAAYGLWLRSVSKGERGERLARDAMRGAAVKARAPRLHRALPLPALRRTVLSACLAQVLANAGEAGDGNDDPEVVHQLRVGLRRWRTAWRELRAEHEEEQPASQQPLVDAFRALGGLRDRSVVVDALQSRLAAAGSPEPRLPLPEAPVADAAAVVRDPAFQIALLDAMAVTLAPDRPDDASPGEALQDLRPAAGVVDARLEALHRQLARSARTFESDAAPAQHRARKRLKRLRYLAELVGSLYKRKRVDRYLERLRPAQDALGRHNDLQVGLDLARRAAGDGDAEAWFNVGWLSAELRDSAHACRGALRRAAEAERFWRRPGRQPSRSANRP